MLELAEEVKDYYAEKMSGLLEAKRVVEVAPDLWITWGSAVHHAKCKAEECKAMAKITQSWP